MARSRPLWIDLDVAGIRLPPNQNVSVAKDADEREKEQIWEADVRERKRADLGR